MSLKEHIYYSSPPSVQNFFVSLAGKIQFSKRYQNLHSLLTEIEQINDLSEQSKLQYQNENIEKMVRFCGSHIPFYQKLFANYGINYKQISSKGDLQKIPLLTKQTVIENIGRLMHPASKKYITQKTSGTTGTPFTIHMDKGTYQLAMTLLVAHEKKHGVCFGSRRATFAGRLIKNYSDNNPPFFRFNKSENQAIFSTYHLSHRTLNYYDSELAGFNPEELIGYPSAIYNLATLYLEAKITPSFKPKIIVTNSETLFSWQRNIIEQVFDCSIYDYYGTAEYILFAGQEKDRSYAVSPILGVHEIIDEQGLAATSGRLIGSSLTNTVMPLLRYEIGDTAEAISELSIKSFTGRIDDQIQTPDGRIIGRTGEVFGFFENIKEAQIIQHQKNYCEVLIVKNSNSSRLPEGQILEILNRKFGNEIYFKLNYVQQIQRSKNGKFKAVKSLLTK